MDLVTLAAAKKYTADSLIGAGAVKGKDGKTPVKGVDYWTEEDKTSIINDVGEAMSSDFDFLDSRIDNANDKIETLQQRFSNNIRYHKISEKTIDATSKADIQLDLGNTPLRKVLVECYNPNGNTFTGTNYMCLNASWNNPTYMGANVNHQTYEFDIDTGHAKCMASSGNQGVSTVYQRYHHVPLKKLICVCNTGEVNVGTTFIVYGIDNYERDWYLPN